MKKKVVRKLMALALVSAMATSMLAGCGSSDDSGKDSGKDADKGSEETVLKVAAFEGGNGTQIWEDIAKAFEESHDGVKDKSNSEWRCTGRCILQPGTAKWIHRDNAEGRSDCGYL